MRIAGGSIIVAALAFAAGAALAAPAEAQQSGPPVSLQSVSAALQKTPQQSIVLPSNPPWVEPRPARLGFLTLVPPDRDGEFVKVVVPVGALASRGVRAVSSAQRRRAERKASERVSRALQDFQAHRVTR